MPSANATKGMIQATRLKPVAVGAAITVGPYSCTKPCRMRSSLLPLSSAASSWLRILSEDWQPTWLHSSNTWPHPQVHIMRWPRSLKRAESSPAPMKRKTAAVRMRAWSRRRAGFPGMGQTGVFARWPSAAKAATDFGALTARLKPRSFKAKSRARFEDFMSVPRSYLRRSPSGHGRRNLHGRGIRHERDDGAEDHDDQANPNPRDQRIQVRFNDGPSGGLVLAFIDQIDVAHQEKIFAEAGVNAREGLRLSAGFIEAALGIHGRNLLAAAKNIDDRPLVGIVGIVVLRVGLTDQGVRADVNFVAKAHFFFNFLVERRPEDSNDYEGDAKVHDVAAVASRIAMVEVNHRGKDVLLALAGNDAASADELGNNGEDYKRRENGGHGRVKIGRVLPGTHAEQNHHAADGERADRGEQEIPLEAFDGSLTPGEQRSDRGEQQEQQGNRNRHAIEKRRSHGDFVSLNELRQDREKRAPQYGEADHEQEEIVEQETGFARHQRFQFVLALQVRPVRYKEKGADRQGQPDEDQEPGADRGLREGVHRTDHTRAREEGPEHGEQEGREGERHVPDLQHAALFLHHDGMQKRCAGEPGHERGILNRVPSPVTAPSKDSVSPVRAEKDANGEEAPGHHSPAARDLNPFLAGVLHDQRAQREGERNREADVSQVQHGWMDDHLGILQKRIQDRKS